MGRGVTYHKRLRSWIPSPDWLVELTAGLMISHRRRTNGTNIEIDWNQLPVSQMEHIPQVFYVIFLKGMYQYLCPFSVCLGSLRTWNVLRNQFNFRNWGESLHNLE